MFDTTEHLEKIANHIYKLEQENKGAKAFDYEDYQENYKKDKFSLPYYTKLYAPALFTVIMIDNQTHDTHIDNVTYYFFVLMPWPKEVLSKINKTHDNLAIIDLLGYALNDLYSAGLIDWPDDIKDYTVTKKGLKYWDKYGLRLNYKEVKKAKQKNKLKNKQNKQYKIFNYKDLELDSQNLPTTNSLFSLILYLMDSGNHAFAINSLLTGILMFLHLPNDLENLPDKNNKYNSLIVSRIYQALFLLLKANCIMRSTSSGDTETLYYITDIGKNYYNKYKLNFKPNMIASLSNLSDFVVQHESSQIERDDLAKASNSKLNIQDIANWQKEQKNNLKQELLNKLKKTNPYAFEKLVVKLLDKMGYTGKNGKALTTKKSGDGGIDGIIKRDELGLNKIYMQAKRYNQNNVVSRAAISQFHSDLELQHANASIFITTSSFSEDAKQAGKKFNIRLIDGKELVNLLIKYKLGVKTALKNNIYEIDNDFFNRFS